MKISRRKFVWISAAAVTCPAVLGPASASSYPSRPLRLIVPFPPGGTTDVVSRLLAPWLSERFGHPVIIENRPGAGGSIGTEALVNAPPDGHTLLLAGAYNTINSALYDNLTFDFARDVSVIAGIMRTFYVMEVSPSFPVNSVADFMTFAKNNPDKISMASAGNGSPQHMAGELFKMMTGVQMVHVPYRGAAPALTDLLSGRVQVMFDNATSSLEHLRAGKLRPLAVTTKTRWALLPDIPTVGEFVPGYEASGWVGLAIRPGTSPDIVDRLSSEVRVWLSDPKVRGRLEDIGGDVIADSPADLAKLIADDTAKWSRVVKFAGIKPN